MVHNIVRHALIPFSNSRLKTINSQPIHGRGAGSVLLRSGGGGAGSSYFDIDDYIHTTGNNPIIPKRSVGGKGLEKISKKISDLNISTTPNKPRKKNIQFHL